MKLLMDKGGRDLEDQDFGCGVDVAPFKQWYLQHYGVNIGRKKKAAARGTKKEGEKGETTIKDVKKSNHVLRKLEKRQQNRKLDSHIEDQFSSGRLLACISSRPGQCGRADGYILDGKCNIFYIRLIFGSGTGWGVTFNGIRATMSGHGSSRSEAGDDRPAESSNSPALARQDEEQAPSGVPVVDQDVFFKTLDTVLTYFQPSVTSTPRMNVAKELKSLGASEFRGISLLQFREVRWGGCLAERASKDLVDKCYTENVW
ncbi:40S ribosomal protein S8 [Hibiscus syriacus]|uniref:40S ribosomal protein S8 n=1 Tax=Hibiscus syriacus TaxID=106335 RepID=A0A6A3D373_HIBSY|nr:40S ribosomal protein S8 [Hibiscus syriacus]